MSRLHDICDELEAKYSQQFVQWALGLLHLGLSGLTYTEYDDLLAISDQGEFVVLPTADLQALGFA